MRSEEEFHLWFKESRIVLKEILLKASNPSRVLITVPC